MEAGEADVVVAGGTESMSLIPMGGHKIAPNPTLLERYPPVYLGMVLTAELVARQHGITREDSDAFALASHQKALAAIAAGRFTDEIAPVPLNGKAFDTDDGPRADTTAEALAKLKPAFAAKGIVTAGNASQMSDGAAASVVMSAARAQELGVKPIARLVPMGAADVPEALTRLRGTSIGGDRVEDFDTGAVWEATRR